MNKLLEEAIEERIDEMAFNPTGELYAKLENFLAEYGGMSAERDMREFWSELVGAMKKEGVNINKSQLASFMSRPKFYKPLLDFVPDSAQPRRQMNALRPLIDAIVKRLINGA